MSSPLDFPCAVKCIKGGRSVSREVWGDPAIFVRYEDDKSLIVQYPSTMEYRPNTKDILALDWKVVP